NTIEISTGSSTGIAINGSSSITVCPGDPHTLEANISGGGHTYTWYKDGSIISGPAVNASTYTINTSASGFEGAYAVEIGGSGICIEKSVAVTVSASGSFDVTLANEENIVLLPSQTKSLSVNTTATSPIYQWYKNGSAISGATNNSLNINGIGEYY